MWHQLMGRNVLETSFNSTNKIRAYAHCERRKMIDILLQRCFFHYYVGLQNATCASNGKISATSSLSKSGRKKTKGKRSWIQCNNTYYWLLTQAQITSSELRHSLWRRHPHPMNTPVKTKMSTMSIIFDKLTQWGQWSEIFFD